MNAKPNHERPHTALIVVDMQYDFISGALPVPGAWEIVAPMQEAIMQALRRKHYVVFTGCNHPPNHSSFKDYGGPWPVHCVRRTHGMDLQAGIAALRYRYSLPMFYKGMRVEVEEYSGFANRSLVSWLKSHDVGTLEIGGLALDYCVKHTAADARSYDYNVIVRDDLSRAVHA